jgi:hypothetical protein
MKLDELVHITLTQMIAAAFALIVTVGGSTFAIVRLATDSQVKALQLQAAQLDTRVRELQAELQRRQRSESSTGRSGNDSTTSTSSAAKEELSIVLKAPVAESEVPQFVDVWYSVLGKVPSGYVPMLFVKDPLGQYWSWGSSSSGFHPRVQLGVATDGGRRFEIGVLVTREKVLPNRSMITLPSGILYEAITVKRR